MTRAWGLMLVSLLGACGPKGNARSVGWTEQLEVASLGSGDCVVVEGGRVRCWGNLDALASKLEGKAVSLASGVGNMGYPRCAVTEGGRVACWGCVIPGRVGEYLGSATQPIENVRQVVVGRTSACVLDTKGRVSCWGSARCALGRHRGRRGDYGRSADALLFGKAPAIPTRHLRLRRLPHQPAGQKVMLSCVPDSASMQVWKPSLVMLASS